MNDSTHRYINRELSWLEFNARVLHQAQDDNVPLLERVKFLAISCTNLDEFFEIRIAQLKQKIKLRLTQVGLDGLTPQESFNVISERCHRFVDEQYRILNDSLIPQLSEQGISILQEERWTTAQTHWLYKHFQEQILPALSPIGLDPLRPFPKILNKSLNFIVRLSGQDAYQRNARIAIVRAPRSLPRVVQLPAELAAHGFALVFLTSIVKHFIAEAFPGMRVDSCHQFRITRNSNLFIDDEEIDDLKEALQGQLEIRGYGDAVRIETDSTCSEEEQNFLSEQFSLSAHDVYRVAGPVNLNRLNAIYDLIDRADLKYLSFAPKIPANLNSGATVFATLRQQDVLLHHPYDSFTPIIDWLNTAAKDPDVVAIKQTLYRTSTRSEIVAALCEAAHLGKEVTAVIELRARFDEAGNIALANQLQEAGAHVVYGVSGLKTHAKTSMIVRREGEQLVRYVHLGTGNYHPRTARMYTDYGLLTAHPGISEDVHHLFLQLTGLGTSQPLEFLQQAPFRLRDFLIESIAREQQQARSGKPAHIIAKMNALEEKSVIDALYQASQAGVKIDLIVRGICTLRPGVPGLSENIRVRSLIGRFLEHSRVYYFHNAGKKEVSLASADWMERNLFRRVELCFPILDNAIKLRIKSELELYLADNSNAWEMQANGRYQQKSSSETKINAQEILLGYENTLS